MEWLPFRTERRACRVVGSPQNGVLAIRTYMCRKCGKMGREVEVTNKYIDIWRRYYML